jgi:hypothetical protein
MQYTQRFGRNFAIVILIISIVSGTNCATAQHSSGGFKNIFDGRSLRGWKGDTAYWRVENNTIVGEVTPQNPLKANSFLIYNEGQPGDFELIADFKISTPGNSGIQYRSEMVEGVPFGLKGYQADIDGENEYTGQSYEERGRGFLAKRGENSVLETGKEAQVTSMIASPDSLKSLIKQNDWNEIHIIAKGNSFKHFINGVLMSEVTDNDTKLRKMKGLLGFQVHVISSMKVEYRNIRLKQ